MIHLDELERCFQGIIPAILATCARDGTPNVTYVSHVYRVDARHVALSRQFLNKSSLNIAENPYAAVQLIDPLELSVYELDLRLDHSETNGPLFDTMALRIQAIASHTGMLGVFRLIAADIYEVLQISPLPEAITDRPPDHQVKASQAPSLRTELRALQVVLEQLSGIEDLEACLSTLLATLRSELGFEHSMVLLLDESATKLYAIASLGYGEGGIGAEVLVGEGLIGTVAKERRILRLADVDADIRYGQAIRREVRASTGARALRPEIPLPGLADARSHIAIPLCVGGRLVGVLAVESRDPFGFAEWHEAFLGIVANQAAVAIESAMQRDDTESTPPRSSLGRAVSPPVGTRRARAFCFYRNDDCVFVDDEYLIRNVPGRILWKILRSYADAKRTDFSNRELRLDPSLGLPALKDNLESRLILLRKRLEEKCPELRMVPRGRGQFRLEVECDVFLVEKESG